MTFDFIVMLLIVKISTFFNQPIIMIFPQFVIFVLIYDYLKFRKDSSFTSQEITELYKCCVSCDIECIGKSENSEFSETIAASDLKVSRSIHLIEYMKICEY